jgi:hypothetical protein
VSASKAVAVVRELGSFISVGNQADVKLAKSLVIRYEKTERVNLLVV